MRYVALLVTIVASSATASVGLIAEGADGSHIRFHHDDNGGCIDGARKAEWVSPDAKKRIDGCWTVIGDGRLIVALRNGMAYIVPLDALKEPKKV